MKILPINTITNNKNFRKISEYPRAGSSESEYKSCNETNRFSFGRLRLTNIDNIRLTNIDNTTSNYLYCNPELSITCLEYYQNEITSLKDIMNIYKESPFAKEMDSVIEKLWAKTSENQLCVSTFKTLAKIADFVKFQTTTAAINKMIDSGVEKSSIDSVVSYIERDAIIPSDVDDFLELRESVFEQKANWKNYKEEQVNSQIDSAIFKLPLWTLKLIDIIGKDAYVYAFKDKLDTAVDHLNCILRLNDADLIKEIQLRVNPKEKSETYWYLEEEIPHLKSLYKLAKTKEVKQDLQDEINTLTKYKRQILANVIKDPKVILETALIAVGLQKNPQDAIEVIRLANPRSKEDQEKFLQTLNDKIYKIYDLPSPSEQVSKKLDFSNEKYLPNLLLATNENFINQFKSLILMLEKEPDKSVKDVFDGLIQNHFTKRDFEKLGIDYDAWCSCNPDSYTKVLDDKGDETGIIVRKADMNDIPHALFLGHHASCCTRIGRSRDESIIPYIKNKMIQSIEVYDGDTPVGNTMCYIALVDDIPSLILDNIELKEQYRFNDNIRNGIFLQAHKLIKEIGKPDLHIYLSAHRNSVNTHDLQRILPEIVLVGHSDSDKVHIDMVNSCFAVDLNNRELGRTLVCSVKNTKV